MELPTPTTNTTKAHIGQMGWCGLDIIGSLWPKMVELDIDLWPRLLYYTIINHR